MTTPDGGEGPVAARVRAAYRRIAEVNRPEVWITLRPEAGALAEARVLDDRVAAGEDLPLAGVVGSSPCRAYCVGVQYARRGARLGSGPGRPARQQAVHGRPRARRRPGCSRTSHLDRARAARPSIGLLDPAIGRWRKVPT